MKRQFSVLFVKKISESFQAFMACDTVIFLDYPTEVCIDGALERIGKQRPDMPWVENEIDSEFTEFIKTYNEIERPKDLELLSKYYDKRIIILNSRSEAENLLKNF